MTLVPSSPAARRLVAGLALAAALGLGVAAPAGANEFPPKPAASTAPKCQPESGFAYTLTNIGGHVPADFTIVVTTVDGTTTTTETVQVDATINGFAPVPEDSDATITISSPYMADVSLTEHVDCFDSPTATITPECIADGETLDIRLIDPDHRVQTGWEVHIAGEVETYAPGVTFVKHYGLADGQARAARVLADGVEVASLDGVTDCVDPTAEIDLECTPDGPVLHVALGRDDVTRTFYEVQWPLVAGASLDAASYLVDGGADGPLVVSWDLPRDTEFSVAVTSSPDGEVASLSGSSECREPEVVEVEETPVPTGPTPTDPTYVPVVPDAVGTTPTAWTPSPTGTSAATGTTQLARTGPETPLLVGTGTTLLALGVAARRIARRLTVG